MRRVLARGFKGVGECLRGCVYGPNRTKQLSRERPQIHPGGGDGYIYIVVVDLLEAACNHRGRTYE